MNRSTTGVGLGSAAVAVRARKEAAAAVKALMFDTFGTIVDWRGSIIQEGKAWSKSRDLPIDWATFADRWRAGIVPGMNKVRNGELSWTNLDVLLGMVLDDLLKEFQIEGLSDEEQAEWNRVWRRLEPWPDSIVGLMRLKKSYTIAPCSNGNVALINDMAKHSSLPWDLILGAELAGHYKPDREAYLTSVSLLGLKPEEVMMCAAHSDDLHAARSFGLRTGFIHRPHEYGPSRDADTAQPGEFDIVAENMLDFASKMQA
jgi:2-haloacid dehalogenase